MDGCVSCSLNWSGIPGISTYLAEITQIGD